MRGLVIQLEILLGPLGFSKRVTTTGCRGMKFGCLMIYRRITQSPTSVCMTGGFMMKLTITGDCAVKSVDNREQPFGWELSVVGNAKK